jgi:copper chaperone CopZ
MAVLVPDSMFAEVIGGGIGGMLLMLVLGIPVYVCATASVPVAAVMIAKGVSPGAALVFLMTGPATNAAAIATIWRIMGRRTALLYLAVVAGSALCSGFLLDSIFDISGTDIVHESHVMMHPVLRTSSALLLLAILAAGIIRPRLIKRSLTEQPGSGGKELCLRIDGMHCSHCVRNVEDLIMSCSGVVSVQIRMKPGQAVVRGDNLDAKTITELIARAGYKARVQTLTS